MCNMQVLGLNNNKIGNPGLAALADAVGKGALAQCAYLYLHQNQIGDAGLSALATAITPGPSGKGALPALAMLWIDSPSAELTAYCSSKSIKLNRL